MAEYHEDSGPESREGSEADLEPYPDERQAGRSGHQDKLRGVPSRQLLVYGIKGGVIYSIIYTFIRM